MAGRGRGAVSDGSNLRACEGVTGKGEGKRVRKGETKTVWKCEGKRVRNKREGLEV